MRGRRRRETGNEKGRHTQTYRDNVEITTEKCASHKKGWLEIISKTVKMREL
jgi:hypothetical protein